MKERPILFSGEMVRALLEGRKTQTRRLVKPQPPTTHSFKGYVVESSRRKDEGKFSWGIKESEYHFRDTMYVGCPYGHLGDRLWVRETTIRVEEHGYVGPVYAASENGQAMLDHGLAPSSDDPVEVEPYALRRRPSIFMPRSMARILLEVTAVRVERLQDISAEDARAEGCLPPDLPPEVKGVAGDYVADERTSFAILWNRINGPGAWAANPWVWVVEFRRLENAGITPGRSPRHG